MYDYFGVQYSSPRFIYTMSTISDTASKDTRPYFIHSSNNHQIPPMRPEGCSWGSWLTETIYLAACYFWFIICCFMVKPKEAGDSSAAESFRQYSTRICLPKYFVRHYFLPLMSCVTTCPHDALLEFPAIDIIGYQTKTFRRPHYTVLGGVNKVQDKLARGQKVRYCSTVTGVENTGTKVKVSWKNEETGAVESKLFDHVVMAVTPDVVRAIFPPLRKALATVPTTPVHSVVHRDFARFPKCSQVVSERIRMQNGASVTHPIHICSNSSATESTHEHPSSVLISTSPIVPVDPTKIVQSTTFTRVLRTPTSRKIMLDIFDSRRSSNETGDIKQWRNGDGNVWLVGGWCWDGMVMLEGCVASALRVAKQLDIDVPWASHM